MIKTFIKDFTESSYYKDILNIKEEIVLIYVGGSHCFQTQTDYSDYDITIITTGENFINAHNRCYLRYKGAKVHWYYCPLNWFSQVTYSDIYNYIGAFVPKYISSNNIIYQNDKYKNIVTELREESTKLAPSVAENLLRTERAYIQKILFTKANIEDCPSKVLYYLVLASYELFEEPLNRKLLKELNLAYRGVPLNDGQKEEAFQRLQRCWAYLFENK